MKKLLYILLFAPFSFFGQEQDPCYSVNDYNILIEEANPPISLDLLSGWNIIGYSCIDEGDALELLLPISDKIILVKNNSGSVYMPEFGFNGIGNLISNQGYQIKMSETALDFEICTNPVPFPQIEGCTDCEAVNFNQWANVDDGNCQFNTCTDSLADNYQEVLPCMYYGCNDPLAANFDPYANTNDGSCVVAQACPYDNYLEYSPDAISYNENLCLNIIVEGCTDNTALNFNSDANIDDNSCEFVYGCIDQEAENYDAEATTDDGSCIYYGCTDQTAGNYDESANTDDGSCLIGGCMNHSAENYDSIAQINLGCIIYGCTLPSFPNYNSEATIGDGSCDMNSLDVFGCTDSLYLEYNSNANIDNGLCNIISVIGCMDNLACNYNSLINLDDGSCYYPDQGYDCDGDSIQPGCANLEATNYDPNATFDNGTCEFNIASSTQITTCDGFFFDSGTLLYNYSVDEDYQITLFPRTSGQSVSSSTGQSVSIWFDYVSLEQGYDFITIYDGESINAPVLVPPTSDGSLINQTVTASETNESGALTITFVSDGSITNSGWAAHIGCTTTISTAGCMDSLACNYNSEANIADESCTYVQLGYDCDGNFVEYLVGMQAEGGIIFYVDSSRERGLAASSQDLDGSFEWGCYGEYVTGADGTAIGTGYQNTLDVVNQDCETENGGITAAQAALDFEYNGYSDWFLPSKDELFGPMLYPDNYNIQGYDYGDLYLDGFGSYLTSSEAAKNSARAGADECWCTAPKFLYTLR